jgi:hypothetical protein
VVAKVMKKLLGSTRETKKFGTGRSNLKLNEVKIRKQYQVRFSKQVCNFWRTEIKVKEIGLGKLLGKISKCQLRLVEISIKGSYI